MGKSNLCYCKYFIGGDKCPTGTNNIVANTKRHRNQMKTMIATGDKNLILTENTAHYYGIILVMYHNTGYFLTRVLVKLATGIKYDARGYDGTIAKTASQANVFATNHMDETTGVQIAFGQRNNWNNNFV